jgi:hypothetical protein
MQITDRKWSRLSGKLWFFCVGTCVHGAMIPGTPAYPLPATPSPGPGHHAQLRYMNIGPIGSCRNRGTKIGFELLLLRGGRSVSAL